MARASTPTSEAGARFRLLLVDDDENYAELVRRALRREFGEEDFELSHLTDGDVALDYLLGRGAYTEREAHPLPDVVLLDERMPRMDGSEVLEELRRHSHAIGPHWPIICHMTSGASPKLIRQCYDMGATFCIAKPMRYERLVTKLVLMMKFFRDVLELPLPLHRRWP